MVEIKKTDLKKLVEQKGQIERRIKSRKLANYKVEQVGGYIADDEIFVPQFKCPDYYVSNYGRVISCKFGKVKLLNMYDKRKTDGMRYKYYCLCKKGKKRAKNILIHRSVAQLFCPNLFKDVRDKNGNPIPLDIHHLNHNEQDNRSENLIWLPKYLHRHCNDIGKFGIFRTKNARNLHPLEIVAQTGLDLKDIILAKRQEPIKKVGKWTVYDVQGHLIALELLNESDKKDDKKYTVKINKPSHKRKEEQNMKNKYLFDANKETLLKNTELNTAEAKKIPESQLHTYSEALTMYQKIMDQRKDTAEYEKMLNEFIMNLYETKDNSDLHPEIKKMYRKLYHAVAYQEDGIIKMNDSAEVIKQIYSDLATIFGYTETEAEALKERLA